MFEAKARISCHVVTAHGKSHTKVGKNIWNEKYLVPRTFMNK